MGSEMRKMTLEEHAERLSEKLGAEWRVMIIKSPEGHVRLQSTRKTL